MFTKVLVANRGEIAVRVIRALKELGVASVAVYSEVDREAPHVREADESHLIGPGPATESYLKTEKILEVAAQSGAEAIHPGYGFLAENAPFAKACEKAGVVFIGPPAKAIEAMGSKTKARALMKAAGVPIVPGTTDPVDGLKEARQVAKEIGYPIAVKAAGGGGGKGFRVAMSEDELEKALEGAAREGEKFFSDPTVYLERYLEDPRHVEVQVLADGKGTVVHLGERDCSVQRRHQKLVEETPAPGVDAEFRERIGKIATDAAEAIGYRSAGTIEGLLAKGEDGKPEYFFLEMNTRVQVEHTVTEMATGIDIVREQIRIAAGERPLVLPGRGRSAGPLDRVPDQRRGRAQEVRPRSRADHHLPRARRPRSASRLRRRGRSGGLPDVRPDGRQADRVGHGPGGRHRTHAAGARRVRGRRHHHPDPVPQGAAPDEAVAQRRDLSRPRRGPEVAQVACAGGTRRTGRGDEEEAAEKVERDYTVEVDSRRFTVKVIGPPPTGGGVAVGANSVGRPAPRRDRGGGSADGARAAPWCHRSRGPCCA